MQTSIIDINTLRRYADFFSKTTLNKLIKSSNINQILSDYEDTASQLTVKKYFTHVWDILLSNYRNENIYKNLIINELLDRDYRLRESTILNEFQINRSIADLVFLNGTSRVYEIKTELDNPTRLFSQITDYQKVFKEVYLVTHYSLLEKYNKIIDKCIGIIYLSKSNKLIRKRKAKSVTKFLDANAIMQCLRKKEYTNIVQNYYKFIPKANDFEYFKVYNSLLIKIPILELHEFFIAELKKRYIVEQEAFIKRNIPTELKYFCWSAHFKAKDYDSLNILLDKELTIN